MGDMVKAIFGGGGDTEARAARERQQIAQARQEAALAAQQQETAAQTRATGRAPRGRRLLEFAGRGEGPSPTLGG